MIYNITICRYFHFQIQKKGLIIKITNIPNSNRLNNPFNNIECQEKLYHHSLQLDHVAIRQRSIRGLSVLFFLYFTFHFYNTIIRGLYSFQTVLQQRFRRCVNLRSDFRKSPQTASKGQTQSDKLAKCLYEAAIKNFPGKRIRTDKSDGDPDWEESFYILRKTLCPAVLTENFFMDNHSDLEYLQSRTGKQAIIDTHVEAITEYLSSL